MHGECREPRRTSASRGSRRLVIVAAALTAVVGCSGPTPGETPRRPLGQPVHLSIDGAVNSGAAAAAAGSDVAIAWAATAGDATNIYLALSHDGGATFATPVRVNDVDGDARVTGEQPPRLAFGRHLTVVWSSALTRVSRVRLATSADGGRTFSPASSVHSDSLTGARGWASVALDAAGAAHVAWLDGRDGRLGQELFQMVRAADGSRVETRIAANVCFCCKTAIAAGPDEAMYVAWRHVYPTSLRDIAVARSTDGGGTFGEPVRVSEDHWQIDGCPEDGPAMAVDRAGVLHVVWPTLIDEGGPGKAIFYSFSRDGGRTFAPRRRVDAAPKGAVPAHPVLALANDRVFVAFDESKSPDRRIMVREIAPDAGAAGWTPHLGALTALPIDGRASYPSIVAAPGGLVVAATRDAASGSDIVVQRLGF